jgi:hypothetical protein
MLEAGIAYRDPGRKPMSNLHSFTAAASLRFVALLAMVFPANAFAGDRLAWTGGLTQVEGTGGGGLVPLALIAGLGTGDQVAPTFSATHVATDRFELATTAVGLGIRDRLELSYARQWFSTGSVVPGTTLGQDVYGAKLRVAGDAVFSAHSWLPQVAVGIQYKRTREAGGIPRAVGAERLTGTDVYVAATRVFIDGVGGRRVLANAVLRRTDANQFGLLGFGGPAAGGKKWHPEATVGVWLSDRWLVGAEYRSKPDGLAAFREEDAADAFVAYGFGKRVTLVGAWVDLGSIAGQPKQRGAYVSLWVGY